MKLLVRGVTVKLAVMQNVHELCSQDVCFDSLGLIIISIPMSENLMTIKID